MPAAGSDSFFWLLCWQLTPEQRGGETRGLLFGQNTACAPSHSRGINSHKVVSLWQNREMFEVPLQTQNFWLTDTYPQLLLTLRVPLNPLITPFQSLEIHIEIPNPAGASRSLGMAAPWLTPCVDARQRPPAFPRKAPLPTWRVLHSHGHYFSVTRLS